MSGFVQDLPTPLLFAVVLLGFAGLVLLADLDRTPLTTRIGNGCVVVAAFCAVVAIGVAVSS